MTYRIDERLLHFKQPAGTSRGVYTTRKIWLVHLSDGQHEGVGECAPLPDLSCDAMEDEQYAALLNNFCKDFCKALEGHNGDCPLCEQHSELQGDCPQCVLSILPNLRYYP